MESFSPGQSGAAMAAYVLGVVLAPVLDRCWALAHRKLFLALDFLHQHSLRSGGDVDGETIIFDPEYIRNPQTGTPGRLWLPRSWNLAGHDANRLEQRAGRRLVQFELHLLAVGDFVVAFIAFVVRQFRAREPLADLRVFADRNFLCASVLVSIVFLLL